MTSIHGDQLGESKIITDLLKLSAFNIEFLTISFFSSPMIGLNLVLSSFSFKGGKIYDTFFVSHVFSSDEIYVKIRINFDLQYTII